MSIPNGLVRVEAAPPAPTWPLFTALHLQPLLSCEQGSAPEILWGADATSPCSFSPGLRSLPVNRLE